MAETEAVYVGIPQSAKTYYHKASNGNVSIMRLATPLNWAEFKLQCNRCHATKLINDRMVLEIAIDDEIAEFCGQHQHNDWVNYKFSLKASPAPMTVKLQPGEGETSGVVTISKEEYLKLIGKLPKTAEESEGRVFRGEEE